MIAERLGLLEEYTEGKSVEEWIKFGFENSGVAELYQLGGIEGKGVLMSSRPTRTGRNTRLA